jgi:CRISPR-associated endoribonuclease Cas6
MTMVRQKRKSSAGNSAGETLWPGGTELVGLVFDLVPVQDCELYPQYTIGFHAWFLDQIRQIDPDLSAYLHDAETEKPFNVSGLSGQFTSHSRSLAVQGGQTYQWHLNVFARPAVEGVARWLQQLPEEIPIKQAPLRIKQVRVELPALTYEELAQAPPGKNLDLSFLSPTSFRRKGHHLPLPWPPNVFHSYLRRWNSFSGQAVEAEAFLAWVEESVIIERHELRTAKVAAGKRGSVTGFTGAITFGLSKSAAEAADFYALFYQLGQFAPYCGTGHKTTFGLGQTRLGWRPEVAQTQPLPSAQMVLAERIAELTQLFMGQRKRTGGERAQEIAETWATILARRELGDSLQTIAADLEMPYETVKTYAKLARRGLKAAAGDGAVESKKRQVV